MTSVLDRFLEYVKLDTTSLEDSETYPSSPNQLVFGRKLARELRELGLEDVTQDEHGYVTATVPAAREDVPVLGLVAHMDTSSAVSGCGIRPRVVYYQGGDILLNEAEHITMTLGEFPYLEDCIGKHLVVTDGTTLLGADDKAGIAEIVTLAQRLMAPDAPPHGKVRLAFTPDEEISGGTDGARLSLAGLPCPNLSTGGYNFHGRYEFIPVESMERMVEVLLTLTTSFAEDK